METFDSETMKSALDWLDRTEARGFGEIAG